MALYATIGKGQQFKNTRKLAAWLGLVPQQHGTGGINRLGPISKRGDSYLRLLLIHGARVLMRWANKFDEPLSASDDLGWCVSKHLDLMALKR